MENMNTAPTPEMTAAAPAQTATVAAPQPQPQKVRRVGTFTFGLTLIAAGVLLLCSILIPGFDPMPFWRLAPVVLIALGLEVLIYAARPNVKLKYDFLSMFACAFILLAVGGASILPQVWNAVGPGHDAHMRALNTEVERRGADALKAVPALRDRLYTADFYLQDYTSGLPEEQSMDLDAAIAAGVCDVRANFILQPGYASAEDFAADCAKVLDACKALPLYDCYFSTYEPSPDDEPGAEPHQTFRLHIRGLWEQDATVERLAAQVDSDWYYRDTHFATREDLDSYLAGEETGLTEEELRQQTWQQGYDEGYAAALADAPQAGSDAEGAPDAEDVQPSESAQPPEAAADAAPQDAADAAPTDQPV